MNRRAVMTRNKYGEVFLSGRGITREFGFGDSKTVAVNSVDFEFHRGEIVSIVGESGSGKTTLAKMVLGLLKPSRGEIVFEGKPRDISNYKKRRQYWRNIQAIFQDPFSTYNIFNKVDSVLLDCLRLQGLQNLSRDEEREKMRNACGFVNLKFEELSNKYPFELSGGQMQRLMIARIFMLKPKLLIADEPTSMIDACSRATILDMLLKLRDEINMTIVFITHDIGLAYYISDTVYIMERGVIVEQGTADEAILNPKSDYTKRLLGDVPKIYEPWDFSKAGA
jgi:peptide/nickel transport system ATP-binding protein